MKNNLKLLSRSLSLVLVVALLTIYGMQVSVYAANTENKVNILYSQEPDLRPIWVKNDGGVIKISRDKGQTWTTYTSPELLGKYDDIDVDGVKVSKETLMALAACSDIPGLSFGVGLMYDNIFSSGDNSVNEIIDTLNSINSELTEIQQNISNMFNQLQNDIVRNNLKMQISQYISDITIYEAVLNNFIQQMELIDKELDGTQKANDQKIFLKNIYESQINGNDFCTAVQALGLRVSQTDPSSNENIFGTFDQLALYSYKWEHQGYDTRRSFQTSVLGLYVPLASFAHLCLSAAKNENFPQNMSGVTPQVQYNNILNTDKAVLNMANDKTVVERPQDQRYYQVPGHECLLLNIAENRLEKIDFSSWPKSGSKDYFKTIHTQWLNHYLHNDSQNVTNQNPSIDWLQSVYADYGKSRTLWDIFFTEDEGNIAPPINSSDNLEFITSTSSSHILGFGTSSAFEYLDVFKLINNKNADIKDYGVLPSMKYDHGKFKYSDFDNKHKFDGLIGLTVLNQGVTPVDFVPAPYSYEKVALTDLSIPKTGDDRHDKVFPFGLLSAGTIFILMLFKKKR